MKRTGFKPRKRKCPQCGEWFMPFNSMQKCCANAKCALEQGRTDRIKSEKAELKQRKDKLKSRSELLREAQAAFNSYIRVRDKGRPCISCDKPDDGSHQRHASHFRSVGAAAHLRFHPLNVHSSCAQCNAIHSGNQLEYLRRLPDKIGQDMTDWLFNANFERRYSIEEAKRIKRVFRKKERLYKKLFRD